MTTEPASSSETTSPSRQPLARGRALLSGALNSLRDKFPTSARSKKILKLAAAPVLLSTAALGTYLAQDSDTPPSVAWSHGTYSNTIGNNNGEIAPPGARPPMTCYRPQRDERHPLLTINSTSWRGFYALSRGGSYSSGLHQSARDLELSICETSDETLVRNYDAINRLSGISKDASLPTNIREAAHGIVHALMQQNNLSTPRSDEALFSRLNRHLTAEAVALTAEYLVAAEMQLRGDHDLMRSLESENHPALRYFKTAFANSRARNPRNTRAALDDAAGATITFLLRQREFIEANSDTVLRGYLGELQTTGTRPRSGSNFDGDDMKDMGRVKGRSFSSEARLLNQEELAIVAPDVARIVEAMEKMHATRNQYRAPRARIADNPYMSLTRDAVQTQINHSGGVYNMRQAFERARYSASYRYSGREWQMGESFRYGMQSDYTQAQAPAAVRPMWAQIDALRRLSPTIGPAMIDHAARANIVMCYGNIGGLLGQWQPDNGIIVLTHRNRDNVPGNTRTIAHELLHLMQNAAGVGSFTERYGIADMQLSSLSREAAASTVSVLIALEFKLNGDDSLWSFSGEDQRIADSMLETYRTTRESGAEHIAALEAAGLAGYQQMHMRQWWQNAYNHSVASNVLERIASGWLKAPNENQFGLDKMRQTGRVNDAFNFTRNMTEGPTDQMRFGNNDDMRHLFAYLHYHQLRKNLGESNPRTVAQRTLMEESRNPYLNVNFDELVAHYNGHNKHQAVLTIINYLSGRAPRPENMPAPTPTPPPPPRVPTCSAAP